MHVTKRAAGSFKHVAGLLPRRNDRCSRYAVIVLLILVDLVEDAVVESQGAWPSGIVAEQVTSRRVRT